MQVCAHPYLFLAGLQPPYEPADPEELVRASGKLAALDNILPKLRATGAGAYLTCIACMSAVQMPTCCCRAVLCRFFRGIYQLQHLELQHQNTHG